MSCGRASEETSHPDSAGRSLTADVQHPGDVGDRFSAILEARSHESGEGGGIVGFDLIGGKSIQTEDRRGDLRCGPEGLRRKPGDSPAGGEGLGDNAHGAVVGRSRLRKESVGDLPLDTEAEPPDE